MPGFCNVPNNMQGRTDSVLWQWPRNSEITIAVDRQITVAGFSRDDVADITKEAYQLWANVSGFRFKMVGSEERANILVLSKMIDGPFGVLAEAELPPPGIDPRTSQLRLWLDIGEVFVRAANPPNGKIDILRVMIHEGGHTLGLGHEMDPQVPAIMDPSISVLRALQPWDINQVQLRYGIAASPAPTPPPGGGGEDNPLADLLEEFAKCLRRQPRERVQTLEELLGLRG